VKKGMTITERQADAFLKADLRTCERAVGHAVTIPITQNEFSALVSFCFNFGGDRLKKSSIVSKLNAGDRAGAADAFLIWVKAGGKVLPHLVERRKAERKLFLS
jgi:lysozyme